MSFTPQFLDELRARISLIDVVSRRVKLTRKAREHQGLCPFHNEKTPSFTVSEEKGFFHCFGCGAHGDVIGFEMRAGGMSFPEAVEKLAGEAGLEVPKSTPEEVAKAKRESSLYEVVDNAGAFYEKQLRLPVGKEAMAYLQRRGLTEEVISRFRLGFAPSGNVLRAHLTREGIKDEQMLDAGLIGKPDDGRSPYDYFRERVIFPITDRRGQPIAFGGRVMGDGTPKYLNSPETSLFHKGQVLYGLAQARAAAHKEGAIIVTEGYMDVIALHRAGFHNAVAPLGTALTEDQIRELWKLAPEPTLCFDGDAAGRRAATRGAERVLPLLKPGQSLRFALLPGGLDPDELIAAEGPAAMQAVLEQALPLAEALWVMTLEGHRTDTPERVAKFEADLMAQVARIEDQTVRDHYRTLMRNRVWEAFKARKKSGGGGRAGGKAGGKGAPPPADVRIVSHDISRLNYADLAAFLLRYPHVLEKHVDDVASVFAHATGAGGVARLIDRAVEILSRDPETPWNALIDSLEAAEGARALAPVKSHLFGYPVDDPPAPTLETEFLRRLRPLQEQLLVREMETLIGTLESDDSAEAWERYRMLHAELERLREMLE